MIDLTKPVQTRDGRKALIVTTKLHDRTFPVAAEIEIDGDSQHTTVNTFTVDGHYMNDGSQRNGDLINVPDKRVVWVNMYPDVVCKGFASKHGSDTLDKGKQREACVRVEYEVGQFDEEES